MLSNLDINVYRKVKLEDEPDILKQSTGIDCRSKATKQQNTDCRKTKCYVAMQHSEILGEGGKIRQNPIGRDW